MFIGGEALHFGVLFGWLNLDFYREEGGEGIGKREVNLEDGKSAELCESSSLILAAEGPDT